MAGEGDTSPSPFFCAVPLRASPLALPLGELSAKLTERVFLTCPLRPRCTRTPLPKGEARARTAPADLQKSTASPRGVDSPYQGEMPRRGKGGRDSCRRRRLMRGRLAVFELHRVFESKRGNISKHTTLLLIWRFAPPSPQGEGFYGSGGNWQKTVKVSGLQKNIVSAKNVVEIVTEAWYTGTW